MSKITFTLVLSILLPLLSFSQETQMIQLDFDTSGYSGTGSPGMTTMSTPAAYVPSVKSEMAVSPNGALTYTVPIEVLRGSNGFQPEIVLHYNSQSGNGSAGWGWNLLGFSMINRGGKTKKTDGVTIGREYSETDPFYLDGQRLLGSGGNNYVTEVYSKTRITKESSEYSFTVQYPDGRIAKFKELGEGQHYISVLKDAYDNEMHYTYNIYDGVVYLSKISYGGTSVANDTFWIDIVYGNKAVQDINYRNGISYITTRYISEIVVKSSLLSQNNGVYRRYILNFDKINGNTVERLINIHVINDTGAELKPLSFGYNTGIGSQVESGGYAIPEPPMLTKGIGNVAIGDFNGTGQAFPVYEQQISDTEYKLWNPKTGSLGSYSSSRELFAGRSLKPGNIISNNEMLITLNTQNAGANDNMAFQFYDFAGNGEKTLTFTLPKITVDDNTRKYIDGDFNNDGLIDIFIFQPGNTASQNKVYFAEIGKAANGAITPIQVLFTSFGNDDRFFTLEFNGDGIPEILIAKNTGTFAVYKVNPASSFTITSISGNISLPSTYSDKTPFIFGDYNGDGLTDFYMPNKTYSIEGSNADAELHKMETEQLYWSEYTSTGLTFVFNTKNFTAQKLAYIAPSQRNIIKKHSGWDKFWSGKHDSYEFTEYGSSNIIPIDINSDGKTDLISFKKFGTVKYNAELWKSQVSNLNTFPSGSTTANKIFFHITKINANGTRTLVNLDSTISLQNTAISPLSLLINVSDYDKINISKSSLLIHDPIIRKESYFTINNDNFIEGMVTSVNTGDGILRKVEYRPLVQSNNTGHEEIYTVAGPNMASPYFVARSNGSIYLAHKLHTVVDNSTITKEYRYQNSIIKYDGSGFLGFEKIFASDEYESQLVDNVSMVKYPLHGLWWTISTYDPLFDNAIKSVTYGSLNPGIVFSKTNYTNKKVLKGNRYIIINTAQQTTDYLKDIFISKNFSYDEAGDVLLGQTIVNYNNTASTIEKITYKPESFNAQHYFFGKVASTENTSLKEGASFTLRTENDYNTDGTLLQKREHGNDTSALIVTDYSYKPYKEVATETVTAQNIAPLVTEYDYDTTHRYIWKKITPGGLINQTDYDVTGRLVQEITSMGRTTSYLYDSYGNANEITDYLGIKTYIDKYAGEQPGAYIVASKKQGDAETEITYNRFGKQTELKRKSLNDQWVITQTQYDLFGKMVKESMPYLEGDNIKWNTTEYDEVDRPVKYTAYTGKITSTCYEGLKITIEEGNKKSVKWSDSSGNIIQQEDGGGLVSYKYFPNGSLKETNYGTAKTKFQIDGWGNRIRLIDPSAGTYEYTYDNLKRIKTEKNPKGGLTTYNYDPENGMLASQTTTNGQGEDTNISITYSYDPDTLLPTVINGTNNNRPYTYTTTYDPNFKRVTATKEQTPEAVYEINITYDGFGRVGEREIKTTLVNPSYTSIAKVKNVYDSHGIIYKQLDGNNTLIWEATQVNAMGKPVHINFSNGYSQEVSYNTGNLNLERMRHYNQNSTLIDIHYNYDVQTGLLESRNNVTFNLDEVYEYDDLQRLVVENVNNVTAAEYTYDAKGRMTSNTYAGKYNYNDNDYALRKVEFNTSGADLSTNRGFATITYNSFKSPTQIILEGKDKISYDYSILKTRSVAYYGNLDQEPTQRPNRKFYSSDINVEITKEGNTTKIITFITGDAYTATFMKVDILANGNNPTSANYFLHRDNQASIVAITKADGTIVEKRYFDAWGNLKAAKNSNGTSLAINAMGWNNTLLIDRGYTGHEHLKTVGLIHMNGRIYDPGLRRFLSPDNFVQEPDNSQSYNRYAYCLNNPLLYTDYNGELFGLDDFVFGFFAGLFSGGNIGERFTKGWQRGLNQASNTFKIYGGMVQGNFGQILSRLTWESPQTLLGLGIAAVANTATLVKDVDFYDGATVTRVTGSFGGFTLGSYILGDDDIRADPTNTLFQHEYGHYLQSQAFGIFYMAKFAIPSLVNSMTKGNHDLYYTEQDANSRAFTYWNEHVPNFNNWDEFNNPIIGYNWSLGYNDVANQMALSHNLTHFKWYDWTGLPIQGIGTIK